MAEGYALDIEGGRAEALGDGDDFGGRHEEKHRTWVNEATDEPGTGNAIDLGPRARHPKRRAVVDA